jgi:hypothetical protein
LDKKFVIEERREAQPVSGARPEALHIYGVDLLDSNDILRYFADYGPTYIEWLDDSSCNVLFPDEFTVKRVLVQMSEIVPDAQMQEAGGVASIPPYCPT